MAAANQGVQSGAAGDTVRLTNSGATEGHYNSPLFALSPSTTYTLRLKARGTVGAGKFDSYILSNTGTYVQKEWVGIPIANAFQLFSTTFTTTADITGTNQYIRFDHNGNDAGYIEIAEVTLIQKAYSLSFPGYGVTRTAETFVVPTAGVFVKGKWTVKLQFMPMSEQNKTYNTFWHIHVDDNNYWFLHTPPSGYIRGGVCKGGALYMIESTIIPQANNTYLIMLSGDGSVLRLCVNGSQMGSDLSYSEPTVSLPANMYVGVNSSGTYQANGIIDDFVIMNWSQTLSEHQAEYQSGLPLTANSSTTYLLSLDGHLVPQPYIPVRYFPYKDVSGLDITKINDYSAETGKWGYVLVSMNNKGRKSDYSFPVEVTVSTPLIQ
jgi:hypothetical protein